MTYMVGKLAPNSIHFTREVVKQVPGRAYFRVVLSQNGNKIVTSPTPPIVERVEICERKREQIKKLRKKLKFLAKRRKAALRNSCSFSQENNKLNRRPIFRFLLAGRYCIVTTFLAHRETYNLYTRS